ncbi:MAG: ABC transporter ATP-binding protein [Dehalococcoidia bacterium]|nr:ABC transporter ATP-binding protein [Dehalococcoidia bacterium]
MLEVNNLNTCYGELQVLRDVSLRVNTGELVILFGPNGHGKSTLLKTICGLLTPRSGSVRWNGQELTRLSTQKLVEMGIVYIAEERHLFPDMTVLDNLVLGAYNANARKDKARNLEHVFELFPRLVGHKNRLARTLSGGEAQMVAIGRGLMSSAKFLAIDEPSFGLAPIVRDEVFKTIEEVRKRGITILLVEQSTTEVSGLADRVYLMEDGRIALEGTEQEVMNNEHVKRVFLGL